MMHYSKSLKFSLESLENRSMLTTLFVTSSGDAGDDTFRDAVEQANIDPEINSIKFAANLATIQIDSPVEYTGNQALSIDGNGATIEPDENTLDLFISSGGGDLELSRLTFQNGDTNGIFVPVPADAAGEVSVSLTSVVVTGNGLHGLHIADQSANSPASIRLEVLKSSFTGNAKEGSDFDGIRVDEGGDGNIDAKVINSLFHYIG